MPSIIDGFADSVDGYSNAPSWIHQFRVDIASDVSERIESMEKNLCDAILEFGKVDRSPNGMPAQENSGSRFVAFHSEPSNKSALCTSTLLSPLHSLHQASLVHGSSTKCFINDTQELEDAMDYGKDVMRQKYRKEWQDHTQEYLYQLLGHARQDVMKSVMEHFHFGKEYMEPPPTRFARFVISPFFTGLIVTMVAANVVWIAYETEVDIDGLLHDFGYEKPYWHFWVANAFAGGFALEIILRVTALRWSFVFASDWRWNLFDVFMVLSSAFDYISGFDLRFARMLRIARMTRVLRIVRIFRFFHDLKQIAVAMFVSLGTLFSTTIMLLLILLVFSLFFMQGINVHIADTKTVPEGVVGRFANLEDSMISLFYAISGGADWGEVATPLRNLGLVYKYTFMFYVTMMFFGVTNIVIGIFCNVAMSSTLLDRDLAVQEQQQQLSSFLSCIRDVYYEMEKESGSGVTWPQFQDAMKDENLKTFLMAHGLNVLDLRGLFELMDELDHDANETIDLETFMMGMTKLSGIAKSTDVALIQYELRKVHKLFSEFIRVTAQSATVPGHSGSNIMQ